MKTKKRKFLVGEKVLLLLPSDKNKLMIQWRGPYPIVECRNNGGDYVVKVGNKKRLYHVNILKKFYERKCNFVYHEIEDISPKVVQVSFVDSGNSDEPGQLELPNNPPGSCLNINPNLDKAQKDQLAGIVDEFSDVFSDTPGKTSTIKHKVKLTSDIPIRKKPFPIPTNLKEVFESEVKNMLDMGIIEPSDSPYCSPVVLVKKTDNSWRLCIDFRALNDITEFDAEPMPTREEFLGDFVNDLYFSEIDLCKGYWQIEMDSDCKKYTAFATHLGLMQFRRMPFGLKTACATFIRLMRKVTLNLNNVACYFDNLVVHNNYWEDHLNDLRSLLKSLRYHGLTAGPSKCFLGYNEIKYLGYSVGDNKLKPLDDKVHAILEIPLPSTKKQLRSFLGSTNFYQQFIKKYGDIVAPLNNMIKKNSSNTLQWSDLQVSKFNELKQCLSKKPILQLPDNTKVFILRSDASDLALGAVLLQEYNVPMPVAYASRKLLDREKRFSAVEKECLAIIWAIEKFKHYLFGKEFILQTDHQPLIYLRNMKNKNGKLMRWALFLQSYTFRIEYIKGADNVGADMMSRC